MGRSNTRISQFNSDIENELNSVIGQLSDQKNIVQFKGHSLDQNARKILIAALKGVHLIGTQVIESNND